MPRRESEQFFAQRRMRIDSLRHLHAHRAADIGEHGIGHLVENAVANFAPTDDSGLVQECQVTRNIGLARTRGSDDRRHMVLGAANRVQDSEARRVRKQREILGHRGESRPDEIASAKCGTRRPTMKKTTTWTTSAMTPQTSMSTMLTLCAMALASGSTKPTIAPASEIAAATLPARISASSLYGVTHE